VGEVNDAHAFETEKLPVLPVTELSVEHGLYGADFAHEIREMLYPREGQAGLLGSTSREGRAYGEARRVVGHPTWFTRLSGVQGEALLSKITHEDVLGRGEGEVAARASPQLVPRAIWPRELREGGPTCWRV
jgi:hypothetical protein